MFGKMFGKIRKAMDWRLKVSQQMYVQLFTFLNLALYSGPFLRYFVGNLSSRAKFPSYLLILVSYGVAMMLLNLVFAAILHGRAVKPLSVLILIFNSLALYLMNIHRIQINLLTVANLFRIGLGPFREMSNLKLATYVLCRGILPSLFVLLEVRIESEPGDWAANIGFGSVSLLILAITLGPCLYFSGSRTFILEKNAHTLNYLPPINYMESFMHFCGNRIKNATFPWRRSGAEKKETNIAAKTGGGGKKNLILLVIGSSARSRNFSLNGYRRKTNRPLEKLGILSYKNVSSCGTSAVHTIPCIFSPLGREKFKPLGKDAQGNLLDALRKAGFAVLWRSNGGGCLGLCGKEEYLSTTKLDKDGLDKSLLLALDRDIRKLKKQSTVIVLNQRGSQEPFSGGYPANFEKFVPSCRGGSGQCSLEEVTNSYDNSLYYSSYNLSRMIEILKTRTGNYNIMLLYVSDHGFGLGEKGRWGHSMARKDAGPEITGVPLLLWFSNGFRSAFHINDGCLRGKLNDKLSQDNIFHSLVGLLGLESKYYNKNLDIFRGCRN
jgi:lipid A ethanolaminephosphotransferase